MLVQPAKSKTLRILCVILGKLLLKIRINNEPKFEIRGPQF